MAAITAKLVMELHNMTGVTLGECKKALEATDGEIKAAVDFLREKGIAKAEKRADRATKEGKVYVASNDKAAVMVELLCETDFVAKNESFFDAVKGVAENVLANTAGDGDVTEKALELEAENIKALFAKFGEKMTLRRALRFETAGALSSYLHGGGKVGVMVDVEGEYDETLLKDICLHIAAFSPAYVCSCEVPENVIEHEKEIAKAQLLEQGKPENMIDKIVPGKINKWFSDVCLNDQPWIRDDKSSLKKLYPNCKVKRFARWAVGQDL